MTSLNIFDKMKRVFLIALSSVILVFSIPQFSLRSEAVGTTSAVTYSLLLPFLTYMASQGYSSIKGNNLPQTITQWINAPTETIDSAIVSIQNKLDAVYPGLGYGLEFVRAMNLASASGKIALSQDLHRALNNLFDSEVSNGTLDIGVDIVNVDKIAISGPNYAYYWIDVGGYSYLNMDFPPSVPCYFTIGSQIYFLFIPTIGAFESGLVNSSVLGWASSGAYHQEYSGLRFGTYGTYRYIVYPVNNLSSQSFAQFHFGDFAAGSSVQSILQQCLNAYYNGDMSIFESNLYADQITDTSTSDLLSTTNTISLTGEVEGDFTLYLLDTDTLVDLLDRYNNQSITYEQLISALGLSTVSSSATVSEKEAALAGVAVPDSTYDWLTKTAWGSDVIASTTEEIEDTQTQKKVKTGALGELFKRYAGGEEPDPEDQNRADNAMLLATIATLLGLWEWPDTDPTAPDDGGITDEDSDGDGIPDSQDPDTQSRLADITQGVVVASSFIGDIFTASGGSAGYGMIFNVGMSFVLFSVIIGASHFLGSMGSHADIQAENNKTPPTKGKQQQIARSSSTRHKAIRKGA